MSATLHSPHGAVCATDHLAAGAGLAVLRAGGNAVDAALATNAVLAVTAPHQCGLGGDLFALVHQPSGTLSALNASGRAGSGADPDALRAEGWAAMPLHDDIRAVTVPGCVDGWCTLHRTLGRLPLSRVLADAIDYAEHGFGASPLLVRAVPSIAGADGTGELRDATAPGVRVRRPGVARTLRGIVEHGRHAFYQGEFGDGLIRLGRGEFNAADLARTQADWVEPLGVNAFGHDIWTMPGNSQGYVLLLSMAIAERLPLPTDPNDPLWAHLLVEAARQAGHDRPAILHESADHSALLAEAEIARRTVAISTNRRSELRVPTSDGDTTYLCAVDAEGMGVSLIQSNASGFGAHIFEPATGIGLHNRGLGFNLTTGHPAEYRPGRRPPHTLAPAVITHPDGSLRAVAGTMGGDSQPQILLQVLTRLLRNGASVADAIRAPRWRIGNSTGFDTWAAAGIGEVELEAAAPSDWDALTARRHRIRRVTDGFGHAHLIESAPDGMRAAAADPRARIGAAAGY